MWRAMQHLGRVAKAADPDRRTAHPGGPRPEGVSDAAILKTLSPEPIMPRILLIDGESGQIPIRDLYNLVDVYLSLHRSEGYGFTRERIGLSRT